MRCIEIFERIDLKSCARTGGSLTSITPKNRNIIKLIIERVNYKNYEMNKCREKKIEARKKLVAAVTPLNQ